MDTIIYLLGHSGEDGWQWGYLGEISEHVFGLFRYFLIIFYSFNFFFINEAFGLFCFVSLFICYFFQFSPSILKCSYFLFRFCFCINLNIVFSPSSSSVSFQSDYKLRSF